MSFKRKQLIQTLLEIFSNKTDETNIAQNLNDDTNYVKTDWGVAFSGGFFKHINYTNSNNWKHCNNIKNDNPELLYQSKCFQPIGYVREKGEKLNYNPVPDDYKDVYGSVCIDDNDILKIITPYVNNALINPECRFVLASGPVLTMNSKITFSKENIHISKYQGDMQNKATMNPYIGNNDRKMIYLAGWLNHAFNLNPRSAVGLDKDGNILLVTVEGRGQRGDGCDLNVLAQIMNIFGCVSSVNLDGGGTADLLYKLPNCGCYIETNPVHRYKYPLMSLENSSSFKFTSQLGGNKLKRKSTKNNRKIKINSNISRRKNK